ncbi:hypothetical protein D9Q98_005975 [Chlorella vulgaris]|uniref:Uncharacterized protein n=1 Tax=Chlorella vulgaris TaxID=3077 RepID=A0A9D4Z0F8_CHLVU|nr:hypothetical protein D9Q98_005975 [Chlorella vulgaris]
MASPLQLLHGPTKLLVGSALSGLAADLALASSSPAFCYVHRPVYDEDTFKSVYGSTDEQVEAVVSHRLKLTRPVGFAAIHRISTFGNVTMIVCKHTGLSVLITVNKWLVAALEEEEKAEAEAREPDMAQLTMEDLNAACQRGVYNACVDLSVQTTRAGLDAGAVHHLHPALARKLIKDLRQSVVRKAQLPWYIRVPRVARTAVYTEATLCAADMAVSCVLDAYMLLLKAAGSRQQRLRRLAMRCGMHAVRAVVVLVAVAVGNGVGSASPRYRSLSMWLTSTAASFLANGYMLALMNRWAPPGPAPAGNLEPEPTHPLAGMVAHRGRGPPTVPAHQQQQQQQQQQRAGGVLLVGQAAQPDAAGAGAVVAAAAPAPHAAGEQLQAADGLQAQRAGAAGDAADAWAQRQAADAVAVMAEVQQQRNDAGVQAGAPDAAEPPVPAPQQRRVVGGPRLPERPVRRNAAVGPDAPAALNAGALPFAPGAPPPAAPATPQFRTDQRAPPETTGDSEDAELRGAASAAAISPGPHGGGGSSPGSSSRRGESPSSSADASSSMSQRLATAL